MIFKDSFKTKFSSEEAIKKALFSQWYWHSVSKYRNPDSIPIIWSRMEFQTPILPVRAKEMKKITIPKFLESVDNSIDDNTKLIYVSLIRADDYIQPMVKQHIQDTYGWEFIGLSKMGDLKYSVNKDKDTTQLSL
jgi:hypothetical protein